MGGEIYPKMEFDPPPTLPHGRRDFPRFFIEFRFRIISVQLRCFPCFKRYRVVTSLLSYYIFTYLHVKRLRNFLAFNCAFFTVTNTIRRFK